MGTNTKIEWTDSTWNPLRGCSHVSEGCQNCYAEKLAHRFSGENTYAGLTAKGRWTGKVNLVEERLLDPMKWKALYITGRDPRWQIYRPRRVFVNSMSDLFHENVTDEMRDRIFAVMALCPQHIFQVLTKRPERMLAYLGTGENALMNRWGFWASHAMHLHTGVNDLARDSAMAPKWPLPNVWLGVSDEGNHHERIDILRETPAAVRFVSFEPLIFDPGTVNLNGLDWVISGPENGPHKRPMWQKWEDNLVAQCEAASIPFFAKGDSLGRLGRELKQFPPVCQ